MIHYEEKFKTSPDNLPNFTTSLVLKKEGNETPTFKRYTIQPDRMNFVDTRGSK